MLAFPGSFRGVPSAFVGLAAGNWGGLRAVEQLQLVYQYREALLLPQRVFLPGVMRLLADREQLEDPEQLRRLEELLEHFVAFVGRNPVPRSAS